MEFKKMISIILHAKQKKRHRCYRTDFWTLWEKARVGWFKRTALKHVYYLGWNRSPAQVGCMRQGLGPGALGRPRGSGWRGRWEEGSGWGTHVNPWLFHFNVWQNPPQKKKKKRTAIWPSNPTSGQTHQGNQIWKRHVHPNVHRSTVYHSQDMEAT